MPEAEADILRRIDRRIGVPGIADLLAERLPPTDLQSLLLAVARRRAARTRPVEVLQRYERDRFVQPGAIDPAALLALEQGARQQLPGGFEVLALSPVCPLGSVAALTAVEQNSVIATTRGTEVVSDPTNVLALECALRRRTLLAAERGSRKRVRLAATHRALRAQVWDDPAFSQHFALLGLCTAGRDEGAFGFEGDVLVEHLRFYTRLLGSLADRGLEPGTLRVDVTPVDGARAADLVRTVIEPLAAEFPDATFALDLERERALDYYREACLRITIQSASGEVLELADGGFTDWTQQLLGNRKERLLFIGIGLVRLAGALDAAANGAQA
jgi:hypothetical protein